MGVYLCLGNSPSISFDSIKTLDNIKPNSNIHFGTGVHKIKKKSRTTCVSRCIKKNRKIHIKYFLIVL